MLFIVGSLRYTIPWIANWWKAAIHHRKELLHVSPLMPYSDLSTAAGHRETFWCCKWLGLAPIALPNYSSDVAFSHATFHLLHHGKSPALLLLAAYGMNRLTLKSSFSLSLIILLAFTTSSLILRSASLLLLPIHFITAAFTHLNYWQLPRSALLAAFIESFERSGYL